MITLDPALSPLSLAVSFVLIFCNKFCEFLQLACFSCHLQVTLAPGPRAVKPARFFATRRANKIQGLSNQYRHFKLFSISTGQNKPPGESQATAASYTQCLCPGVSAPSPAPHPRASLSYPLALDEYLREKSGKHHLFLRSMHPGHPLHQYSWAQPSAGRPRAARGGSVITEARGARRPPARTHAVGPGTGRAGRTLRAQTPPRSRSRAPSKPHGVRPASVRGPRSRHRLEHPTAKALRAQPSAGRPPAARWVSVITEPRGARRPPARTHSVGPGTGKSGADPTRSSPATLPL